jgi:hypothetical protein
MSHIASHRNAVPCGLCGEQIVGLGAFRIKVTKPAESGWNRRKMRLRDFCHKLLLDHVGAPKITGNLGQKKNVSTRLLSQIDVRSGN